MNKTQQAKEAQQKLFNIFKDDVMQFAHMMVANHFRGPSPLFHEHILYSIEGKRYFACAAPRESAKSTIIAFLLPLHKICFQKKRFIVIVSNTYKKASETLETIKKEFRDNERIKGFGVTLTRDAEGDTVFRHPDKFETRVLCKGVEQMGSIRGEKFGAYRPDLIICDDLEDDEMVRNPIRRMELQEVFDQALIPAGDKETCDFYIIGTILHDDALMAKLVNKNMYPEYKKLIYRGLNRAKDGSLESLWDYKWTVADLLKLRKEKPDVFAKEIQNNPVAGYKQKFKKEDFRYWKIDNMQYICFGKEGEIISKGNLSDCKSAIACDLAWEEGRQNDFSVILPAFLTPQSDILIDDYTCKKGMRPSEIEEELFTRVARLRAITGNDVPVGFEKAKLEKVIKFLLGQAMRRRNVWLTFKDLLWDKDKISRIETTLQPRYAQHSIYHKQGSMQELEAEAVRFPAAAHDDVLDALTGVCRLLTFPKQLRVVPSEDNVFDRVRQICIDAKKPISQHYLFGKKIGGRTNIPYQVDYK
jgi:hypothetical protein